MSPGLATFADVNADSWSNDMTHVDDGRDFYVVYSPVNYNAVHRSTIR